MKQREASDRVLPYRPCGCSPRGEGFEFESGSSRGQLEKKQNNKNEKEDRENGIVGPECLGGICFFILPHPLFSCRKVNLASFVGAKKGRKPWGPQDSADRARWPSRPSQPSPSASPARQVLASAFPLRVTTSASLPFRRWTLPDSQWGKKVLPVTSTVRVICSRMTRALRGVGTAVSQG